MHVFWAQYLRPVPLDYGWHIIQINREAYTAKHFWGSVKFGHFGTLPYGMFLVVFCCKYSTVRNLISLSVNFLNPRFLEPFLDTFFICTSVTCPLMASLLMTGPRQISRLNVRMDLPCWFDHREECFSSNEVHSKMFCLYAETSSLPSLLLLKMFNKPLFLVIHWQL